jgi:hypothetical protein
MAAGLLAGCLGEIELGVVAGVDACHRCNMLIDQENQACGYIEDGELVVFDAPGCLLGSYDEQRAKGFPVPDQVFFADYQEGTWHPARSTAFLLTDHISTVMDSRVICFGSSEAAEAMRQHPDERVTDWFGYRTARGAPNIVVEVVFDATAMVPEVVEVAKGDLVLWKVRGEQLEHDVTIAITGYPEAAAITIPASGEEVDFRILALRPGSGFPVIDTKSGKPLGRVKVSGAHTLEEEEM